MTDTIKLQYLLKQPMAWNEKIEVEIPLSDITDYMQITKSLAAMIPFLVKIGYATEMISEAFNDISQQLSENLDYEDEEDPNYTSSDQKIDNHMKKIEEYFTTPDLTLAQFKKELSKEAFIQYIYSIYISDSNNEERIID